MPTQRATIANAVTKTTRREDTMSSKGSPPPAIICPPPPCEDDLQLMDECAAAMVLMTLSGSPRSTNLGDSSPAVNRNRQLREEPGLKHRSVVESGSFSSGIWSWPSSSSSAGFSGFHSNSSSSSSVGGGSGRSTPASPSSTSPHCLPFAIDADVDADVEQNEADDDELECQRIMRTPKKLITFHCTWPGCRFKNTSCSTIETHIRKSHLGPRDPESVDFSDHEEEFYYTETEETDDEEDSTLEADSSWDFGIKVNKAGLYNSVSSPIDIVENKNHLICSLNNNSDGCSSEDEVHGGSFCRNDLGVECTPNQQITHYGCSDYSSACSDQLEPRLIIDMTHMELSRPPHEDPQFKQRLLARCGSSFASIPGSAPNNHTGHKITMPSGRSLISPKTIQHRRNRAADLKKCRKVYGMERREQWCTQCRWKKACTRFIVNGSGSASSAC